MNTENKRNAIKDSLFINDVSIIKRTSNKKYSMDLVKFGNNDFRIIRITWPGGNKNREVYKFKNKQKALSFYNGIL